MKKVLLVVSLVSVLLLAGCNKEEKVDNNVSEVIDNQQQEISDNNNIEDNNYNVSINESEQYKLSDNYYLNSSKVEQPEYNIVKLDKGNLNIVNNSYTFESDGKSFTITIDKTVDINGKPITLPARIYNDKNEVVDAELPIEITEYSYINIGVIDLDENDNYKDIVVENHDNGMYGDVFIYRVNGDGLKLLKQFDTEWSQNGLMKIDNKWIYANTFGPNQNYDFILGYDLYEDGEFKHIDRLLTGELISNSKGELPENFQKIVFRNNANDGGPCIHELSTETEFNIVSYNTENNKVSIRILKGGYINEEDFSTKTPLAEGTVLKDMSIGFMW